MTTAETAPGIHANFRHPENLPRATIRKRNSVLRYPLNERIAALEAELEQLRQQQRLIGTIAAIVGPGVAFSAGELWHHQAIDPDLRTAFDAAGIRSPRQLGKRLRQLCGAGLTRIGEDRAGVLWTVEVPDDFHRDPCPAGDAGI